ncbi:MAG: hypothetical protein ACO1OO_05655 [Flavisolibacter sp.]
MKKIFLTLLMAGSFMLAVAAAPNDKVLANFNRSFPSAQKVAWSEYPDAFVVYFVKGDEQCRLWYNKEGEVVKSIRYYERDLLHPFIRSKVEKRYKGWDIKFITEVSSEEGTSYNVTVEKGNDWHSLMVNTYGQISVENKYRKR